MAAGLDRRQISDGAGYVSSICRRNSHPGTDFGSTPCRDSVIKNCPAHRFDSRGHQGDFGTEGDEPRNRAIADFASVVDHRDDCAETNGIVTNLASERLVSGASL
jgi:hypothetical protein